MGFSKITPYPPLFPLLECVGEISLRFYPVWIFRQIVSISGKGARFPTSFGCRVGGEFFYSIAVENACCKGIRGISAGGHLRPDAVLRTSYLIIFNYSLHRQMTRQYLSAECHTCCCRARCVNSRVCLKAISCVLMLAFWKQSLIYPAFCVCARLSGCLRHCVPSRNIFSDNKPCFPRHPRLFPSIQR